MHDSVKHRGVLSENVLAAIMCKTDDYSIALSVSKRLAREVLSATELDDLAWRHLCRVKHPTRVTLFDIDYGRMSLAVIRAVLRRLRHELDYYLADVLQQLIVNDKITSAGDLDAILAIAPGKHPLLCHGAIVAAAGTGNAALMRCLSDKHSAQAMLQDIHAEALLFAVVGDHLECCRALVEGLAVSRKIDYQEQEQDDGEGPDDYQEPDEQDDGEGPDDYQEQEQDDGEGLDDYPLQEAQDDVQGPDAHQEQDHDVRASDQEPDSDARLLPRSDEETDMRIDSCNYGLELEHLFHCPGADVFTKALALAMRKGSVDLCTLIVECGNVNVNPALRAAAESGRSELCEFLITRYGAFALDEALHAAARSGHLNVCQYLATRGAGRVNCALKYAARFGHIAVCEYLIRLGANEFDYALKYAARCGSLEVCQLLLEAGGACYEDTLVAAAEGGVVKVYQFFEDILKPTCRYRQWALYRAASRGHIAMCEYLVSRGAHLTCKELDVAARLGREQLCRWLLRRISFAGFELQWILSVSCFSMDDMRWVHLLVEKGASLSTDALCSAARAGNLSVCRYLVDNGVEANGAALTDMFSWTDDVPDWHVFEYMLARVADVPDLLHLVVRCGLRYYTAYEDRAGPDVNDALKATVDRGGCADVAMYLIDKGARVDVGMLTAARGELLHLLQHHLALAPCDNVAR
jgi:hypothetical protein